MTCIAGVVEGGEVFIGADSAGVDSGSLSIFTMTNSKLFRLGEEMLIGYTSSFRMAQLIKYHLEPPIFDDSDLERQLVTKFIPPLRQCLSEGGFTRKIDGVESGGEFLIGLRGRLFFVDIDFMVGETTHGYGAVGCGMYLALGSLASTKGLPPHGRIIRALEAATLHSAGVRPPFFVDHVSARPEPEGIETVDVEKLMNKTKSVLNSRTKRRK